MTEISDLIRPSAADKSETFKLKEPLDQPSLSLQDTPLRRQSTFPDRYDDNSRPVPGMVSIVMPAYNSGHLLKEAAASVIRQTYPHWELIVVDDASDDDTLQIAEALAREDSRIRVIPLPSNAGVANARNCAMPAARGQYLAFLDSDDLWLPDKLKMQTEFMQHNEIAFSFTQYRRIKPNGHTGAVVQIPDKVGYQEMLKRNVIGCLTVMLDRNRIPPFSMAPVKHEDYVTWLQILKLGYTAWGLQEDLARYRISSTSVSGDKRRSALWTWKIYREIEGMSLAKALWCFTNYTIRSLHSRFPTIRNGT